MLWAAAAAAATVAAGPLPRFSVPKGTVTLSGVSSGGAFAIQFHIAHSSRVLGVAALAAPPYWCANDNVGIGMTACMTAPDAISVTELAAAIEYAATLLSIDAPSNLRNTKVYLESGRLDTTVRQGVVNKSRELYSRWVPDESLFERSDLPAAHCWPTDSYGNNCSHFGSPYINDCGFDVSGEGLQFMLGTLKPRVKARDAGFMTFDQSKYFPALTTAAALSLSREGVVYVPAACNGTSKACRVHVSFHGCEQDMAQIGDKFYRHVGLNEWAEANDIVVIYPQTVRSEVLPLNPKACWDWFAYTGVDYATKLGPQIEFVKNMLDAVSGGGW